MKQSKIRQELKVKLSVKYAKLLNKLTDNLSEAIKRDTEIEVIKSAMMDKPPKLARSIAYNGLVEDSEEAKEKVDKIINGLNTNAQLKAFIEK